MSWDEFNRISLYQYCNHVIPKTMVLPSSKLTLLLSELSKHRQSLAHEEMVNTMIASITTANICKAGSYFFELDLRVITSDILNYLPHIVGLWWWTILTFQDHINNSFALRLFLQHLQPNCISPTHLQIYLSESVNRLLSIT